MDKVSSGHSHHVNGSVPCFVMDLMHMVLHGRIITKYGTCLERDVLPNTGNSSTLRQSVARSPSHGAVLSIALSTQSLMDLFVFPSSTR
jgi:hypothetical protein